MVSISHYISFWDTLAASVWDTPSGNRAGLLNRIKDKWDKVFDASNHSPQCDVEHALARQGYCRSHHGTLIIKVLAMISMSCKYQACLFVCAEFMKM